MFLSIFATVTLISELLPAKSYIVTVSVAFSEKPLVSDFWSWDRDQPSTAWIDSLEFIVTITVAFTGSVVLYLTVAVGATLSIFEIVTLAL